MHTDLSTAEYVELHDARVLRVAFGVGMSEISLEGIGAYFRSDATGYEIWAFAGVLLCDGLTSSDVRQVAPLLVAADERISSADFFDEGGTELQRLDAMTIERARRVVIITSSATKLHLTAARIGFAHVQPQGFLERVERIT